jgi:hypothetical protein
MIRWDMALLLLVVTGAGLAGCSSKSALPRKTKPAPSPTQAAPTKQPEHMAKPAARESALSTYSNPEYGVAFRYPRNFALAQDGGSEEGAAEDSSGVRSQEELVREEPGAVLVATLVVPDDAYPNTTFAGGSVQFAVNRYMAAGSCRQSLLSRLGDASGRSGAATIQGVEFAWIDNDEGDASTEFFERDYAGFTNGTCYEFFLRVGVAAAGDSQDGTRPPDDRKILGHMEKIVSSVEFESQTVSALDGRPSGQVTRRRY